MQPRLGGVIRVGSVAALLASFKNAPMSPAPCPPVALAVETITIISFISPSDCRVKSKTMVGAIVHEGHP